VVGVVGVAGVRSYTNFGEGEEEFLVGVGLGLLVLVLELDQDVQTVLMVLLKAEPDHLLPIIIPAMPPRRFRPTAALLGTITSD
jgi:hypothetical protein